MHQKGKERKKKERKRRKKGRREERKRSRRPRSTKTDKSSEGQYDRAKNMALTTLTVGLVLVLRVCQGEG